MASDVIGTVLSGATTRDAVAQLREEAERGKVFEGMLVGIRTGQRTILARIAGIVPHNAFYTEGDPWSEARRKGLQIPEDVARRYEVASLELLIQIPREEVRFPPQPSDQVSLLDLKGKERDIFGVGKGDPGILWYGSMSGYKDAPIPLDIEAIPMHAAIFGVTGTGKSFDTGVLIERLASLPTSNGTICFPMIIVDAHGDYSDYTSAAAAGREPFKSNTIRRYLFPHQYDRRADLRRELEDRVRPLSVSLDSLTERELAETVMEFYKGSVEGAEMQVAGLDAAIDNARAMTGLSQHELFLYKRNEIANALGVQPIHDQTKKAIERALARFYELEDTYGLFSKKSDFQQDSFIDNLTKLGGIAILDFSADGAPGVELPVKQFVMSFIAAMLFRKFTEYKTRGQTRFLAFLIEEAQNFCPDPSYPIGSSLGHAKLSAIATQGRKFGLSLILISQRPAFVDRIVLSMCNTFFIHRISPEDVAYVRSVTGGLPASLSGRLTTLNKGELILTGQMSKVPFPLLVRIGTEDRIVPHTAGRTEVLATLVALREES